MSLLTNNDQTCVRPNLGPMARRLFQTPDNSVSSERAFSTINYPFRPSKWVNYRASAQVQYIFINIFINKRALENMGPNDWAEEEMLLIEDMHIAEEVKRLEQNLMGIDGENRGDNLEDDIPEEQDDGLVI